MTNGMYIYELFPNFQLKKKSFIIYAMNLVYLGGWKILLEVISLLEAYHFFPKLMIHPLKYQIQCSIKTKCCGEHIW